MENEHQSDPSQNLNPSKRSIRGLNALLFFISDVRHGIGPLLSIYLKSSLGWNSARIGTALALTELGGFLTQFPAGMLADASKSKRFIIIIACCMIILGCLTIRLFPYSTIIFFAQFMMGISIALIPSAIGAITLGLVGRANLPIRVSKNEMWNHAGNLFTTLTIGILSYELGNKWIFYTLIIFSLASILSVYFIRPNEINYKVARELTDLPLEATSAPLPISKLLKRSPIIIFNLSLVLYYMANGAQMTLLGQLLTNKEPTHYALFITSCLIIAEFVMIFVAYGMSKIVNLFHRKVFFLTAFLILPVRAILYTVVDNSLLLLSIQVLDGLAAGILGVIGTIINSDLAVGTGRFNLLQGMGNLSTSIGEALSQIIGGLIAQFYGFSISFFFLAFIGVLGSSFFWLCMPETKKLTSNTP